MSADDLYREFLFAQRVQRARAAMRWAAFVREALS